MILKSVCAQYGQISKFKHLVKGWEWDSGITQSEGQLSKQTKQEMGSLIHLDTYGTYFDMALNSDIVHSVIQLRSKDLSFHPLSHDERQLRSQLDPKNSK